MDLIPFNPADKVERPKKQRYIADYYRQEELERLLEASKDHPYSLLIQMTAFYGLRRSEALGLKWDAIDFERDTITIKHIVTNAKIDGKCNGQYPDPAGHRADRLAHLSSCRKSCTPM